MKKYIKPIVIAHNINAEQMICESLPMENDYGYEQFVNDREGFDNLEEILNNDWN